LDRIHDTGGLVVAARSLPALGCPAQPADVHDMVTIHTRHHGCWISQCWACGATVYKPRDGDDLPSPVLSIRFECCEVSWVDNRATYVPGLVPPPVD
jgi:hypothetical protein